NWNPIAALHVPYSYFLLPRLSRGLLTTLPNKNRRIRPPTVIVITKVISSCVRHHKKGLLGRRISDLNWRRTHVRFGSKADIAACPSDGRFTPESGHVRCKKECPPCANSGHSAIHSITSSARASSAG